MKIVLTGSLGHINKPLTKALVQKDQQVTVVSRNAARREEIEDLGASAAIGNLEDPEFLRSAFTGADAVYCMTPMPDFFEPNTDLTAMAARLGRSYAEAIRKSGVKKVIYLSSVGAHTNKNNGILRYAYETESILNQLPADISIKFIRPVGFYYNLLAFIPAIKSTGFMASNYGGGAVKPWVATGDIAAAVAGELLSPFEGRKICYVASDELSCDEIARILGAAIGKPDLKWIVIPDEQMLDRLTGSGMNADAATGFVAMNAGMQSGELYGDYYRHKPVLGKTKIKDFALQFAEVYRQS